MKQAERAEILEELARSGLSVAEYSKLRGLGAKSLYRWQAAARRGAGGFSRVQTGVSVELEVSGLRMKVPLESLRAVIRELSHED